MLGAPNVDVVAFGCRYVHDLSLTPEHSRCQTVMFTQTLHVLFAVQAVFTCIAMDANFFLLLLRFLALWLLKRIPHSSPERPLPEDLNRRMGCKSS